MIEEMSCICRRCDQTTDCLLVTFVVQHGFDDETTMPLCETCYDMYSSLYTTHLEDDDERDETLMEHDEDPAPPDTNTTEADIDDPL